MTRVLLTQTATGTIQQMRSTITGGVTDQIERVNAGIMNAGGNA
jgi:hypothetical protein